MRYMKCANCDHKYCEFCNAGDKFQKKAKANTNFDRIKAMSVEEMAEFLSARPFCEIENGGVDCVYGWHESKCKEHIKQYLESEVQEDV